MVGMSDPFVCEFLVTVVTADPVPIHRHGKAI
jgi:hypothetical protein